MLYNNDKLKETIKRIVTENTLDKFNKTLFLISIYSSIDNELKDYTKNKKFENLINDVLYNNYLKQLKLIVKTITELK